VKDKGQISARRWVKRCYKCSPKALIGEWFPNVAEAVAVCQQCGAVTLPHGDFTIEGNSKVLALLYQVMAEKGVKSVLPRIHLAAQDSGVEGLD
jgi:hypothetical protein